MTLTEWIDGWPYAGNRTQWAPAVPVPDSPHDEAYRALAWRLTDYRVTSVTGGTIWFMPRLPTVIEFLHLSFREAERAHEDGRMTDLQWEQFRSIWRYSAPRFTATVDLPSVTAIYAYLDGAPLVPYSVELEA